MKKEDLKILGQLSLETQLKVRLKLSVSELFAYTDSLNENEKPEQKTTVIEHKTPVIHKAPVTVKKERIKKVEQEIKEDTREEIPTVAAVVPDPVPAVVDVSTLAAAAVEQADNTTVKKERSRKLPLYYTAKEIENVYDIKEKTVLEWQDLGLLKVHHKRNQICYYKREDILKVRRDIKNKKIEINEWQGFSQKIVL
jgi:hypothetical protein